VCRAEDVQVDEDALFRVARAARGSMRDGLSLLDQLLAAGSRVTDADVVRVLGTPPDERMLALAGAIAEGSCPNALKELADVLDAGVTLPAAAAALCEVFRNMMVASTCGADSELIELPEGHRRAVGELAERFSTPALVHAVALCRHVCQSLRGGGLDRALMEAAIVRLAEAEKFVDPESLIERLEGSAAAGSAEKKKSVAVPQSAAARPAGPRRQAGPRAGTLKRPDGPPAGPAGGAAGGANGGANGGAAGEANGGAAGEANGGANGPGPGAADKPAGRPAVLSTAERNELAQDATVRAAMDLFGGQVVDIRVDAGELTAADPAEDAEGAAGPAEDGQAEAAGNGE
ncbi:MAG: hypothetical protein J7M21_05675, partial [Planctomycetes bacterium]|nr:hypothetical protein [Planctomycetota bacterium]